MPMPSINGKRLKARTVGYGRPMEEPLIIDTKMHGREGITASFVVRGEKTALVETGPKTSVRHVMSGLERAGIDSLDWIVPTHIHLDHAGAAGTLLQHFPDATVAVHSVGAPHLVDPSKLWKSATRIYGDAMESMWGGIDPIPENKIRALGDGDTTNLGGRFLQAIETPGHAYHHHAYLDDSTGSVFVGDALGVRLPDIGVMRPATPPPEWHIEKAVQSIERIRELDPTSMWLTHFGPHGRGASATSVAETCDRAIASIREWEGWVRNARGSGDIDETTQVVRERARHALEQGLPDDLVDRMEQTTSYRMNVAGYMRYFDKQEQSA
jgi:glyoxylase-like metal-dependent hydrolase (beta-lactamase superfamily II)